MNTSCNVIKHSQLFTQTFILKILNILLRVSQNKMKETVQKTFQQTLGRSLQNRITLFKI